MKICVYGASSNYIDKIHLQQVELLGEKMAERGHSLVFGAGTNGCMGASARGVHKHGGEIIGIAPTFFNVDGVLFEHCTKLIGTETMRERKQLLEDYSEAFIIAPGGVGTLDEFFEILTLKQLVRHKKAMAVFNVNGYYDELLKFLETMVKGQFARPETLKLFEVFTDIDEMLDYIEKYKSPDFDVQDMKHIPSEPHEHTED